MNNTDPQLNTPRRTPLNRAFTLIEILIVIALTAVLFALLIIPLVSALRYTKQAQIVTAAQDAARITRERITRELGSAVFVFDGTSHPFTVPAGNTLQSGDDRYTNFLDLQIPMQGNPPSSPNTLTLAHAYNAKIDFVLPKTSKGAVIDPTVGDSTTNASQGVNYTPAANGSAIISNPSLIFPLAAGSTMIRYFVGLRDPSKPYNNTREGRSAGGDDNTYILYRAEFSPYKYNDTPGSGKPAASANTALFASRPKLDANGQPVTDKFGNIIYIPELDDPDFFRHVSTSDTNWLNSTHAPYTALEVTAHNARVDKWAQIAKPVIPGPNVDLLLLPHNSDNTLAFDPAGGAFPGVAHSGAAHDPVANKSYPIVNTSVTFRPATVSGSATPGTTSDYNSSGVVAADTNGFTYVPTVYTATSQSWSLPFHVSLYPGNYDPASAGTLSMYYDTEEYAAPQTLVSPPSGYTLPSGAPSLYLNPGDILEYRHLSTDTNTPLGTLVYNITQGYPVTYDMMSGAYTAGGTDFVPMTINPDTGTITFSAPWLPNGPYDRATRQKDYGPQFVAPSGPSQADLDMQNKGGITAGGDVDLTLPVSATPALTDSPLAGKHLLTPTGTEKDTGTANAHLVPGSLRVTGPDQTSGPNHGLPVTYTEVNAASGTVGDNQFSVDYRTGILHLLPGTTGVGVIYDYQANLTLSDPTKPFSFSQPPVPDNLYQPMQVKVDYQTRDLIDVNIGVRIYDITTNRAQIIPTETKVKIGNSNR